MDSLKEILGEKFGQITEDEELSNSQDIFCKCKTLILRRNQGKLILPTELMQKVDKNLDIDKNFIRGCYWLVDDMYKFDQIGYTKEIKSQYDEAKTLRYLVCADCNQCPLGWFDSSTKESYLYVW